MNCNQGDIITTLNYKIVFKTTPHVMRVYNEKESGNTALRKPWNQIRKFIKLSIYNDFLSPTR